MLVNDRYHTTQLKKYPTYHGKRFKTSKFFSIIYVNNNISMLCFCVYEDSEKSQRGHTPKYLLMVAKQRRRMNVCGKVHGHTVKGNMCKVKSNLYILQTFIMRMQNSGVVVVCFETRSRYVV
jgi:hypothetical protein